MKTLFMTLILSTSTMASDYVSKLDGTMENLTKIKIQETGACSVENLIAQDSSGTYSKMEDRINTIHDVVIEVSKKFDVNPCMVLSMIAQESAFKDGAKSKVGAKGLMQVMPKTKKSVIKEMGADYNRLFTLQLQSGLSNSEIESIIVGTKYYKFLVNKFKNDFIAVIAYNEGPTKIQRMINLKISFGTKHNHLIKVKENLALIAMN